MLCLPIFSPLDWFGIMYHLSQHNKAKATGHQKKSEDKQEQLNDSKTMIVYTMSKVKTMQSPSGVGLQYSS